MLVVPTIGAAILLILGGCAAGSPAVAPAPTVVSQTGTARSTDLTTAATAISASAVEQAAAADGHEIVWGAVSNCTCHEYIGTSSVASAVDNAQVGATVHELSETASDVYFYVLFDPRSTSRDRVVAAIKGGGGRVKAGPPTSLND
jgi:hypothetical protein